jgi:hypothetical protein
MKHITLRPFSDSDVEQLDAWREKYWEADLELPKGYIAPGVETVLAEKKGRTLSALTATQAVVLDPLIRDPEAVPLDIMGALLKQEAALTYSAAMAGAVDAYIAVPVQLKAYIALLKTAGYEETVQNCVVMRRPLRPDTHPLLGPARDARLAQSEEMSK